MSKHVSSSIEQPSIVVVWFWNIVSSIQLVLGIVSILFLFKGESSLFLFSIGLISFEVVVGILIKRDRWNSSKKIKIMSIYTIIIVFIAMIETLYTEIDDSTLDLFTIGHVTITFFIFLTIYYYSQNQITAIYLTLILTVLYELLELVIYYYVSINGFDHLDVLADFTGEMVWNIYSDIFADITGIILGYYMTSRRILVIERLK